MDSFEFMLNNVYVPSICWCISIGIETRGMKITNKMKNLCAVYVLHTMCQFQYNSCYTLK